MTHEKQIKTRVYLAYILMCIFAIAIIGRVAQIQFFQGEKWKAKAETQTTSLVTIDAVRGNIFASDGSLLGTSKAIYTVHWDAAVPALTEDYFNNHVETLSRQLSQLFHDKSTATYRRELTQARNNESQFHLIKRKVDYKALKQLREFDIFNRGQYGGGLIIKEDPNKRVKP